MQMKHNLEPTQQLELDPDLVRHITQNLVGNSLKYSPVHKPVLVELKLA
ncbi:MAG: ATP-binding protein [Verrucomicrobia bacterium]|nr:ATP-binding protein [Verrucomicrobiota bacterium]